VPLHLRRRSAPVAAAALVLLWTLAWVPSATAIVGDRTGINVIAPIGRSITGTIKGADTNAAIAHAVVSAYSSDFSSYGSASVNASGVFLIRGLKPSLQYVVTISPSDGIHYGGCYTSANANHFLHNCPYPQPMTTALTTSPLNIGIIKVPKGFTISGTVKGGTTTSNVALVGVDVSVNGTTAGSGYGSASSGAGGAWSVTALPPGTYHVSYSTPSTMNYRDGQWKSNGGTNWINSVGVPGDIVITTANKAANVILPTGFTVQGYVKNTAGTAGLAGAGVGLECQTPTTGCVGDDESAVTDATGHYIMRGAPAGTYRLSVEPKSLTNYQTGYYTTTAGVTSHFKNAPDAGSSFAVSAAKTLLDVRLPAGFRVTGTVERISPSTVGVQGAFVAVSGSGAVANSGYASTAANGTFTVVGLNPGTYTVQVLAPSTMDAFGGYFDAVLTPSKLNLNASAADTKALSAGVPTWAIGVVHLRQGYKLSGTISGGTVASHVAINGAFVIASKTVAPYFTAFATTTSTGAYSMQGLPAGDYRVSYSVPSSSPYRPGYYKSGAGGGTNWVETSLSAGTVHVGP